jgi:hypothetical protein
LVSTKWFYDDDFTEEKIGALILSMLVVSFDVIPFISLK